MNQTGGSTGTPVQFLHDSQYRRFSNINKIRLYQWIGYRPGDPFVFIWGAPRDSTAHLTPGQQLLDRWGRNLLWLDGIAVNEGQVRDWVPRVQEHAPTMIVGFTSLLGLFARAVADAGASLPSLRGIQSSGENLTAEERELIEDALGAPVYDRYGCREVGVIAHECPAHTGLHTFPALNLVELLGPDGHPAPPGTPGRIVVTNLHNYAMPFIRYEIGDIATCTQAQEACPCGRQTRRIESIEGRICDAIVSPSGRLLHWDLFYAFFWKLPDVFEFQVQQDALDHLTVLVVPRPGADVSASYQRVRDDIRRHADPAFRVDFVEVDDIARAVSGKRRLTVSSVPNPFQIGLGEAGEARDRRSR